ncbi:MAG: GNAT family N-acetyltransferase [Dysgonamonadaceae bacterium]|jgi:GNAT superfamily N-acetyltransferase|nr:GNAT family N-acetyltransferase [Dysgonamonadaceae bacterium]
MIRWSDDTRRADLKVLWKYCFPDDTDLFIDFYFENVYRNDETLLLLNENRPVASLQMIPYNIKTGKTVWRAGYISGAMTHPAFRQRGYMGRLLDRAFHTMRGKGYACTFLIPQRKDLQDFYAKRGYLPAFPEHACETVEAASLPAAGKAADVRIFTDYRSVDLPAFHALYARFLSAKTNAVLKTERQTGLVLFDFFSEGGVLFACREGIAFTFREKEAIVLKEFFYNKEENRRALLRAAFDYYLLPRARILNAPGAPVTGYRGMIKRLDCPATLPGDLYMRMMLD